ncbi:MAG TPA: RNA polymerase sigma factor SigZ [Cyclobacteriaceae bacterium]|nr:RNA polymerase sigma factor SigZ [Cyclobacteriaceae bacterium]
METSTITNWSFFQNELQGFVFKRVKDKALAEDIVHDVFLKVQGKMSQLKESEKITSWIYQITKNTIIDHFRHKSKSIQASDLNWDDDAPNFNECVANCLNGLLPTLPQKYREALQLTELENLSQLELADRLGISYSGAKSRVQRARKILKDKMDELLIVKTDSYGNVIVCEDRGSCC